MTLYTVDESNPIWTSMIFRYWNYITIFFIVAADQSAEKLEEKLDAHDEEPTAEETNEEKWWIDQVLKAANVLFISFW